ncbi:MAG TPA: molecular chaperone DnaJ [Candidatus Methanomethylophilaceae archaeon]|nr:molecular chaperone DnaJ [Candidatus Methanomethylophilaceae archaeon]
MPEDYYEILGLDRNASKDEIKKAYRRLARQYHPDVTTEDKKFAEEKFKAISEAYEVLVDDEKRRLYDQYGHAGLSGQFSGGSFTWDDFSHFEDLRDIFSGLGGFGDIFDMFFGGPHQRREPKGARQGESLRYDIEVNLEDLLEGLSKEITIPHSVECPSCHGTGGKGGEIQTCSECGGSGQVQSVRSSGFGRFVSVSVCPKCGGEGQTYKERCPDCNGSGRVKKSSKITVNIPPGVEDGARLRIPGAGDAGFRGGPPGDLFVVVHVKPHETFRREGTNLWVDLVTSYPKLALGSEEEVPIIDGGKAKLKIPPGTQVDTVLRMPGHGLPPMGGGPRGDQLVRVRIHVPKKLSAEEKNLLRKLGGLEAHKGGSIFGNLFRR